MTPHLVSQHRLGAPTKLFLGANPPQRVVKFKLHNYLNVPAITVPKVFGHINLRSWGMMGNSTCGDCVVAGSIHEVMALTNASTGTPATFTEAGALAEYRDASGWNGVEGDPSDTGLDMEQYASRRRSRGITDASGVNHKILAYAEIDSWNSLLAATYVFGAAAFGMRFPSTGMRQFDNSTPWVYVAGARDEGGHYVPVFYRNSTGNLVCVTWGRLQAFSRTFWEKQNMLSLAYINPDYINAKGLTPEQFNLAQLQADLAALAGT